MNNSLQIILGIVFGIKLWELFGVIGNSITKLYNKGLEERS